jgi:hypothetical protein
MPSAQCRREMKIKLTTALLAMVTAAGMSVASVGLKATAPQNVDLTALWKINEKLSDDPQEVLARKRDEGVSGGSGAPAGPAGPAGPGGVGRGRVSTDIDVGDIFGGTIGGHVGGGRRGRGGSREADDPEPSTSMRVPLDSFLATREQFEIEQHPDALTFRTLDETTTCKPAEPDKAPLPGGELVDRRCGWQGAAFVIELKAPDGVTRINRYELRKSNQQLVMTSQVKGGRGRLRGLQIRRVYDRLVAY